MQRLKLKLNLILDFIDDKSDVIYLDYPLHYNIGDILIFLGGMEFFKFHKVAIKKYYCTNNFDLNHLRKKISKNTTLLCHGGGNFGDIYINHQEFREKLIKAFPENRIIFLPQTVHFSDSNNADTCKHIFLQHSNTVFFARDQQSFNYFKTLSPNTFLMPDMAHFLYERIEFNRAIIPPHTLYFLRKDIEKSRFQQVLCAAEESIDWDDIINDQDEKLLKKIKRLMKLNKILKHSKIDDYVFSLWYQHCWNLLNRSVQVFEQSNKIVTSRLHGHILTCLLERESVLINNSYGKNKAYYDSWMNSISKFIQ